MPIFRTDTDEVYNAGGLVSRTVVTRDVTTESNGVTLRDRAAQALTANATFLALASPTNAQTLNQVQTLTKECSALIRLLLGQLDTTSGT